MHVAIVNTNRIRPPIAPIGLDYVAEALNTAGHHVEILDLCWADDWGAAVRHCLNETRFDLIGVTLRNTDDCAFTSRQSFLDEFVNMINTIRKYTDALIVVGGVGFSVMPEEILRLCKADAGLWGDGELGLLRPRVALDSGHEDDAVREQGGLHRRDPPAPHVPLRDVRMRQIAESIPNQGSVIALASDSPALADLTLEHFEIRQADGAEHKGCD